MRIECWLPMFCCAAFVVAPAAAQTDFTTAPGKKGHQFSPALRTKMAERTASLRANAAAPVGPLFDHAMKNWTIEAADCPLVKSQVKGTGFKGHTVWVAGNDDGSFHLQIRTEASGTAVDASGNKYLWNYNELADLDTPDPTVDEPIITGYGPGTFQLIPLTTGAAGFTVSTYLQVDAPTSLHRVGPPVANAPAGCEPL